MASRVGFIFITTIFFLFIVNVSALVGSAIITGFEVTTAINLTGISVLDIVIAVINNIAIFVQLTFTSSAFGLFGTVVVVSYTLAMVILILEMFRGN